MSQSPQSALRLQRYVDGWEAINRMIREGGSWSGRERNCFHLSCGDGTFADISAASGLDYIEDGRALARLDFDRDGRPDLALRNRNAPQLRLLRNVWPQTGNALWLRLEGRKCNRGAIGARVTVRSGERTRTREVTAGAGFLSQSSRWLCFGLGDATTVEELRIVWPGATPQSLGALEANRRYRIVEGEPPQAEPFRSRQALARAQLAPTAPRSPPEATAAWLLEPLPAPELVGRDPAERERRLSEFHGRPLLVQFFSKSCAVCRRELPGLREISDEISTAGGSLLLVSVDVESSVTGALSFLQPTRSAVALQTDAQSVLAWNIAHRHLFNWRRDLVVPTTFLLNPRGEIEKVYRGRVAPKQLLSDLRDLPESPPDRLERGLPFPGTMLTTLRDPFQRDLLSLGNAYHEAGLADLARQTFERNLRRRADDVDALFNYAISAAEAGAIDGARRLYERILELRPGFGDARNNLGILEARSGTPDGLSRARQLFREVVRDNPFNTEAFLNLATTYLDQNRLDLAERTYREALEHDPDSAVLHRSLGYALWTQEKTAPAIAEFRRSLTIDPLNLDTLLYVAIIEIASGNFDEAASLALRGLAQDAQNAHLRNTLGMARLGLGEKTKGVAELERAIEADPRFDRPYLNLARFYLEEGKKREATAVLESLLAVLPGHPMAQELMAQIHGR